MCGDLRIIQPFVLCLPFRNGSWVNENIFIFFLFENPYSLSAVIALKWIKRPKAFLARNNNNNHSVQNITFGDDLCAVILKL